MSSLTQTEQSSAKSKNTLSRRTFLKISAIFTAWLVSACAPIQPETGSPISQGLETTLKLMRGEMPSAEEVATMVNQLGIQKESQLAGILIDIVRLQPDIDINKLLNGIGRSNESINQRISDLLTRLSQEVDLFHYDHPINHRMAFAQARAREQGVGVNEYLAKELFDRVEDLITKSPDLAGLFPATCPRATCEQRKTIPQEIFQEVQLALYFYETLQLNFVDGAISTGSDHAFLDNSMATKIHDLGWINSQEKIDAAHEAMLVALFPMVPEELVLQNDEKRLGDRSSTIALFGEQLTDICLYLLRQSVNNEVIFQKIQTLFSQLQQQIEPTRIVTADEVKLLLSDPTHERIVRDVISDSIARMAVDRNINLTEQFQPIVKPITVITFKDESRQIVIPEETFPTNNVLHRTAKLYVPSIYNGEKVSEFIPLLKTGAQNFLLKPRAKGLSFYSQKNEIIAVSAQNIAQFAQNHPEAQALTIQSIAHRNRGELGAAVDNVEDWLDQGLADLVEFVEDLANVENKNSLRGHRIIGTIAVCKTNPQEYISNATPLEHPAKSLNWITITQGPDNLYYAHNPKIFPNDKGPHYASVFDGVLTVQTGEASDTTGAQKFRVLDEISPGYYTATLDQIPQTLFEQFLRQVQPEETTKKIALLLRQAVLTTNSGGIHNKQYVVVPKDTATAYLFTIKRDLLSGDKIEQTTISTWSRDPQPVLGSLTTTANKDGELCLRLATIRKNGLGNGSPEAMVLVPKNQVDVIEVPTLEDDLQHHAYSQFTVFAAFSVVSKFLNTNLGGDFDLGYALFGALQELVRRNSGIGTDINP